MQIVIMILVCTAVTLALFELLAQRRHQQNLSQIKQRMYLDQTAPANNNSLNDFLKRLPVVGQQIKAQEKQLFSAKCEAELPRMLEILSLGMKAGLNFDAALSLYVRRFDTTLAGFCLEKFEVWERGLISREAGLHELAAQLDLPLFSRFVSTAIRAINYGAPMAPLLKDYAAQARKIYRDRQREMVAKAPVKMLIPTGALILPAMLMLVIGPIVLDVTGRMV